VDQVVVVAVGKDKPLGISERLDCGALFRRGNRT
jgi:hypothetical protein